MKILLIGASGQLGKCLMPMLVARHDVVGTYRTREKDGLTHLDIANPKAVDQTFAKAKPDLAILAGAITNVDYCEEHKEEATRINAQGSENVANAAKNYNARVIYLSSDYVFDGEDGPYDELAAANPVSHYGLTKLEGERAVGKVSGHTIIRTTVVYNADLNYNNFFLQIIKRLSKGETQNAYIDQFNTPTYAPNLAQAIAEIIEKKVMGIINVAGTEFIDRYNFALKVARAFGLKEELVKSVTTAQYPQKAVRPPKGGLVVKKAQAALSTKLMGVDETLKNIKRENPNFLTIAAK